MPSQKVGRILDIGCGSGDTLVLLQSVGWDVYGVDIDPGAIRVARKRGLRNVDLGTYEDLKRYPDDFFDAIRLYHVIEHLDDPSKCLKLARQKLKAGGELIIGTPNAQSIAARIFKQYWYNLDCPRHLHLFSPKTLGTLLMRNSFTYETTYASAGGWVGSIQYVLEELTHHDIDLINRPWLVMLIYPFEWVLDRFGLGDIFVSRAKNKYV
jgi:SAM-dependent methyltransferase